jgi:photosystem II stability/assembly factor-like uncharacterized protein
MADSMRRVLAVLLACAFAGAAVAALIAAQGAAFRDPLEAPSPPTRFVTSTHLGAVAPAGGRLVAVGVHGLIVLSDDRGATWRQAPSPVSSDLVAVRFTSSRHGWASGHDGVILGTTDGGEHWTRLLDGRMAAGLLAAHFAQLEAAGDAQAAKWRKEVARNYENGPEMPILDLWFENESVGWAAGPFGTLLGTKDGGRTWTSWIEKVEGGKMLHYNAVREVGGNIYLASEQGLLFKLDRAHERFTAMATGYKGSFFGVIGTRDWVVAYGLRGTAYRSVDGGAKWERLATGVPGGITGATLLDDGQLLFVSQDGRVVASRDQGANFQPVRGARPDLFTDVAQVASGRIVITGLGGVQEFALP